MRREELKAHIQPELEQDFDVLYEEWSAGQDGHDFAMFVEHLRRFNLISAGLHDRLLSELNARAPSWEVAGRTVAPLGLGTLPSNLDDLQDEEVETQIQLNPLFELQQEMLDEGVDPTPSARTISLVDTRDDIEERAVQRAGGRRTFFRRVTGGSLQEIDEDEFTRQRRRGAASPEGDKLDDAGGRYRFIRTVGEGAMGRVHLAEDLVLNRRVAYKAMSAEIKGRKTLASKFTAEAQITAQLDHPNIVPVYNLESSHAYTMKLIQGRTLKDILEETAALYASKRRIDEDHSESRRLEFFLRVCDAMYYAHSRGVVHRDLKPENVMVGAFGELYVMDWGIARIITKQPVDDLVHVDIPDEGSLVIGTPGYMSPEQADGDNDNLDGRSDQYAMGLMLYELVSLRQPVTGATPLKIVMRHQDGEIDPLQHLYNARIATELRAIIRKATNRNPDKRYASVRAMGDDVRRYLHGEAVMAKPDNPLQALQRLIGRHRLATLGLFVMLFTASSVVMMMLFFYSQLALSSARSRAQTVSTLVTTVARQGSLIDGQFLKYEGLVSLVAATATDNLARPIRDRDPLFMREDYGDERRRPPMADSDLYGFPVNLRNGVFALPTGAERNRYEADMQRLQDLDRHFFRVLLRSHSEEAASMTPKRSERALTDVGVPLRWAWVGLENGVFVQYPGHAELPAQFEVVDAAHFGKAKGTQGPQWGVPTEDVVGTAHVLPCFQSLYTEDKEFLGVAGVDLRMDVVREEILVAPEFRGIDDIQTHLLDAEARIVLGTDVVADELETYPNAAVAQAVRERRSGTTRDGDDLIIYHRMPSIGWYYVVAGDLDLLLDISS